MTLVARGLTLAVPGRTLVTGLDLALAPGRCCAILGRNGAGKSSLLLALAGLGRAAAGEVLLDGAPLASHARRRLARRLGILLQYDVEDFWGSVLEYVLLGRLPHGAGPLGADPEGVVQAHGALAAVDLQTHVLQPYRTLSGGERQRARIAQLLVQSPDYLLLDEPLSHLDLQHQLGLMQLLAGLARSGRAVAMALHEPFWAARFCDVALLMYDSGAVRHGPVHDVLTQENLEALYRCRLEAVAGPGAPLYFPDPR
ncbi:MAG: ABC transporter ATP-binding protein [Burkholderiales bacterium]|nr:ABC transporter ATP-binding protein [Burkholderiales bacterium]